MRKSHQVTNAPVISRWDYQVRLLAWMATCVSVFSFLFYFRQGDISLYGDAVAHINIARRIFDSQTPGLLQLGTVWLPLTHLLMAPFLISDKMWRNGAGGSIPTMLAYVFGVVGIFRLTREGLGTNADRDVQGRDVKAAPERQAGLVAIAPWIAAGIYAANPNLIYMQTTAMGEALYLALFVWSVVYFAEFVGGDSRALTKCGLCVGAACLTRYDAWFLAGVIVFCAAAVFFLRGGDMYRTKPSKVKRVSTNGFSLGLLVRFVLICSIAPVLWLAYNAAVYRNPLEFANGPYSARAIERNSRTVNPAKDNLYVAEAYFLKAAELNVAEPAWLGRVWLVLPFAGIVAIIKARKLWPLLMLWIPLVFYALSIAYGSIPIFVPPWWPFSQYNVRYGLELLPAFAVSIGVLVPAAFNRLHIFKYARLAVVLVLLAIVVASYSSVWAAGPICFREAQINSRGRVELESGLAEWLAVLPPNSTLLMYLGAHPGAVERASFALRRVINEGNHRVWIQPSDPEGLWERALANPGALADYAIAFEGDAVWQALRGRGLKELVEIKVTGQPRAVLYQLR
ncbi:MAG TPA: hypothetical protein VI386_35180 [Candidatus Sulfotelmatobacter sp.]